MTRHPWTPLALLFSCLLAAPAARAQQGGDAPAPSFRNDVMPILSKSGCNAGGCHGNKTGKGGFKLSLRGQDVDDDYTTLARDLGSRRVNLIEPDQSLLLQKPTAAVAHEGGVRFKPDSREYQTLRRWIDAGAPRDPASTPKLVKIEATPAAAVLVEPADRVRIAATALFSDGSRRDVSSTAVYEQSTDLADISPAGDVRRKRFGEVTVVVRYLQCQQPVRLAFVPARADFRWAAPAPANYVDDHVFGKLRTLRMNPSADCGDAEFARRAHLDLTGLLPTPDEVRAFISEPPFSGAPEGPRSADKRAALIDRLLQRPEFADHWALKWSDLLKVEERTLDRKGVQAFHAWIRQSIAQNKPLDQFVRELLAGRGSTYANPPANYYRANRDPVTRGEATAQLFLGVRLQCAQCHNHPFDRWTQDDYYQWADVFARVNYKVLENARTDTNDAHEFVGEQIVYESRAGDVKDPRTGEPTQPRLLGAKPTEPAPGVASDSRLDALAAWVTAPDNPYFAKAQVNRIWFHLMGRGLVDPVDDFRPTNPASHPELLDALAADFVAHRYDLRHAIRTIMTSRAYALSGVPDATNADDETNYSHALPRRLSAEQLLDAMHQVLAVPAEFAGYPKGLRAGQLPGVRAVKSRPNRATQADTFLQTFGKPSRQLVCECERTNETTLGQTFQLVDGPGLVDLLAHPKNRLSTLIDAGTSNPSIIEDLFWAALARAPTAEESATLLKHVDSAPDRRKALEDVAWALLNSKEFLFRR